jgi:succinyl-diaminopimelate desuccinylase
MPSSGRRRRTRGARPANRPSGRRPAPRRSSKSRSPISERSDERALAERLIAYDTSQEEGIKLAAGFVKGWLEARDIDAREVTVRGLPVAYAEVGPTDGPTVLLHGHLDVVPGRPGQFEPRVDGDQLIGRGAYDMKGAAAAMMLALHDLREQHRVRVRLGLVPDEESEEEDDRGSDHLVQEGFVGDFAITGEPTDLYVGVEAKGVLAMRLEVTGRAAHGATPWLGENAVLKAYEVFRQIESLPFAAESSELFDRPSINLGRIWGGDALNKVPDTCVIDVDIRYLPEQEPARIVEEVSELDARIVSTFRRPPATVDRDSVWVRALCDVAASHHRDGIVSVGRDGASDAVSFLRAGIPAVEFGPIGGGHHGPDEWVSISSLERYRRTLTNFVETLPDRIPAHGGEPL